ncbi:MAG: PAC2 family protein [Ignisphaera sp.]|nr:PAC2 family protein [Ignisphaera sp.]MCX8168572.1 PAC2 family protein [Ignisphaera sp.]MDW8085158.1 PAC2 family protein [Ignisphaera sp.]
MKGYRTSIVKSVQFNTAPILVTGFHGYGAVGYLATRYIVSKLNMELIGFIEAPLVVDFTSIEDYGLSKPHEIFIKQLNDVEIVALLNRINPDRKFMASYIKAFIDMVRLFNVKEIFLIGGLDVRFREDKEEFRWLKTKSSKRSLDAPYFMKGAYIVGPLASMLLALEEHGVSATAIFPYTEPESIDHRAAASAIKVLSSILGIDIDVSELVNYAEKIEEMEKLIQSMQLQQSVERKESMMHT